MCGQACVCVCVCVCALSCRRMECADGIHVKLCVSGCMPSDFGSYFNPFSHFSV